MVLVYSSQNSSQVNFFAGLLENAGILCQVRNEALAIASGEIPPTECWVELWVVEDAQVDNARLLLEGPGSNGLTNPSWKCPKCGEMLEGQFSACWSCGEPQEGR